MEVHEVPKSPMKSRGCVPVSQPMAPQRPKSMATESSQEKTANLPCANHPNLNKASMIQEFLASEFLLGCPRKLVTCLKPACKWGILGLKPPYEPLIPSSNWTSQVRGVQNLIHILDMAPPWTNFLCGNKTLVVKEFYGIIVSSIMECNMGSEH